MKSSRRIVVLTVVTAVVAVFAVAPGVMARGTHRGAGDTGNAGDGDPKDGTGGSIPLAGYPGSNDPGGDKGPGAINFGADGGQQRDIHRDVFARRCRDEQRDLRDDCNRRTADPAAND